MEKCPFCGNLCKFKPGEVVIHSFRETYSRFPVSDSFNRYVIIVNPKCLFGYKTDMPVVKGHDYICRVHNNKETFPVTEANLQKISDPNNILKEMLVKENNMSAKENFQDFKQSINKSATKNKLKEKKRLEKERKKHALKEQEKPVSE